MIVGYEYTYDELGRITTETSLADSKKYEMTYDNLSRVTASINKAKSEMEEASFFTFAQNLP